MPSEGRLTLQVSEQLQNRWKRMLRILERMKTLLGRYWIEKVYSGSVERSQSAPMSNCGRICGFQKFNLKNVSTVLMRMNTMS